MAINAYSFLDTQVSISGPNGSFQIGAGSGVSGEGLTVSRDGDKDNMSLGADGTPLHSLHAAEAGMISLKLQKTSPLNSVLMQMYSSDSSSAAVWGQNTITIRNPATGDSIVAVLCAFRKVPDDTYATDGGMLDWVWNAGRIIMILGDGNPISNIVSSVGG